MADYVITRRSRGMGTQAVGVTALGVGVPSEIEPVAERSSGSRYIDPATRDYAFNSATNQLKQMPPTRQRVLLAMLMIRGSSTASPNFGLKPPRKMGASFVAEMQAAVRQAVAHLTLEDAPVIRIDQIKVERLATGRALTTLSYTDLETGKPDTVPI